MKDFFYSVRGKITSKGQITVPSAFRKRMKSREILWDQAPDGSLTMTPLPTIDELFGCLKAPKGSVRNLKKLSRQGWDERAERILKKGLK